MTNKADKPHTFILDKDIIASEVNANFDEIYTKYNSYIGNVDSLLELILDKFTISSSGGLIINVEDLIIKNINYSNHTHGGVLVGSDFSGTVSTPVLDYFQDFDGIIIPINNIYDGYAIHALQISGKPGVNIVSAPIGRTGNALKCTLYPDVDYSGLLVGTPKAEIVSVRQMLQGRTYIYQFDLYIPSNFEFDYGTNTNIHPVYGSAGANRLSFAQSHQRSNSGTPPLLLGMDGTQYMLFSDRKASSTSLPQISKFHGNVNNDLGTWNTWKIEYKLSDDINGFIKIYKNDIYIPELSIINDVTAHPFEDNYDIQGLYKWGWKTSPTQVINPITLYYKNILLKDITS